VHLRPASISDIPGMHKVRVSVHENRLAPTTKISESDYVQAITSFGQGWVVCVEDLIVAFAVGYKTDGNIWALFVHPDHEGRGFGKALHTVMVHWLWANGLNRLWLTTTPSTRAEGFYRHLGWRSRGLTPKGEIRFELEKP
jgi:GNAT superfamily N-acetyltransferase